MKESTVALDVAFTIKNVTQTAGINFALGVALVHVAATGSAVQRQFVVTESTLH